MARVLKIRRLDNNVNDVAEFVVKEESKGHSVPYTLAPSPLVNRTLPAANSEQHPTCVE